VTREEAIAKLLDAVEEVVHNNDWPTEAGHMTDGPILELVTIIRIGE